VHLLAIAVEKGWPSRISGAGADVDPGVHSSFCGAGGRAATLAPPATVACSGSDIVDRQADQRSISREALACSIG
jgi:hypothetical protein